MRFGIDPSTQRVAVAVADRTTGNVVCALERSFEQFGPGKSAQRLHAATIASQELFRGLVEHHGTPDVVVWERPFGGGKAARKVSIESHFIIAAILVGVVSACGPAVRVLDLPPQSWKSRAGLGGRAEKGEIMAWAREQLPGVLLTQDEADAVGIAVAALTIE